MRLNKFWKTIIGLGTAWVVIWPFLMFLGWMIFIAIAIATSENTTLSDDVIIPTVFFPLLFMIICSSFIQLGLTIFYLVHVILNKTANDALRVIFGILIFLFSFIAMPIYYFIYILPENPPEWAMADREATNPTSLTDPKSQPSSD